MSLDVFLSFNGECRSALDFYAGVFGSRPGDVMTYGQNPEGGAAEADKDRVLYAYLPVFGANVMFSDCPSDYDCVCGSNISLTLGTDDESEIKRVFGALADGGTVQMPLGSTFWSGLFGMVTDKFGITWQLSLTKSQQ
jgi:PhnB protein